MNIGKMLASYIETALWSSNDNADDQGGEPLDANYGPDDIAPETRKTMAQDCVSFIDYCNDQGINLDDQDPEDIGHDFWLTRNHHGAGFWDGDYPKELGDALTKAAHTFSEVNLYVGDDGQIHGD
jgi:hypothetical protein